jgi:hypothetical protein
VKENRESLELFRNLIFCGFENMDSSNIYIYYYYYYYYYLIDIVLKLPSMYYLLT